MELIWDVMVVLAAFWFGVTCGARKYANSPKAKEFRTLDKMDDRELALLFMAVGSELETRGMVERVDNNPFEEFKKK